MTDKELIQALKDNEKPFGLMSAEMQDKAREIGSSSFSVYVQNTNGQGEFDEEIDRPLGNYPALAYRLRPDYEPEQEVVRCEVELHNGYLKFGSLDGSWWGLHKAVSRPDFIGFLYEDDPFAYPDVRRYKGKDGLIYSFWTSGREVIAPAHVLFRGAK